MLLLVMRCDDKLKGKEILFNHIYLEKKRITYPTVLPPIDFPLPEIRKKNTLNKKFLLTLICPTGPKRKEKKLVKKVFTYFYYLIAKIKKNKT